MEDETQLNPMKNRKAKFLISFFSVLLILLISFTVSRMNENRIKQIQLKDDNEDSEPINSNSFTAGESNIKKVNKLSKLKTLLDSTVVIGQKNDHEDSNYLPNTNEEQEKRREERFKKLNSLPDEVYWSKSAEILEDMMQNEPKDNYWKKDVESYVKKAEQTDVFEGTEFEDIDCGTSLCKAVSIHSDRDTFEKYQEELFKRKGPFEGDQMGTQEFLEDGRVRAVLYFSRAPGNPMPFRKMKDQLTEWVDSQDNQ